jgi:hypothetical protein
MQAFILAIVFLALLSGSRAFTSRGLLSVRKTSTSKSVIYSEVPEPSGEKSKGFGAVKKVEQKVEEKDAGTTTYEAQAKRGVPEYNIFLRPQNGTDAEWVPVGSMVISESSAVISLAFWFDDY